MDAVFAIQGLLVLFFGIVGRYVFDIGGCFLRIEQRFQFTDGVIAGLFGAFAVGGGLDQLRIAGARGLDVGGGDLHQRIAIHVLRQSQPVGLFHQKLFKYVAHAAGVAECDGTPPRQGKGESTVRIMVHVQ